MSTTEQVSADHAPRRLSYVGFAMIVVVITGRKRLEPAPDPA